MSRLSRYATAAALAVIVGCASAQARTFPKSEDAFASERSKPSEMDIRKQCFAEAKQRYPSTSQDVQTNRVYTYTTCAFDRGVRP